MSEFFYFIFALFFVWLASGKLLNFKEMREKEIMGVALILSGALGNLTDRAFNSPGFLRGSVTDWIVLPHWPNFNLADSAIVTAAILAFVLTLKNIPPTEVNKSA